MSKHKPAANIPTLPPFDHGLHSRTPTQARAIEKAHKLEPSPTVLVERVRHTNRGKPDQWRKP
ncbi:MAG: hypothetical protein WA776_15900 [Xanthobacteraceae bacterium]